MQIETATPEDSRAIAEVHVESWRQAYKGIVSEQYLASLSTDEREAMWLRILGQKSGQVLVVRDAGQVVGFSAFGRSRDPGAPNNRGEIWAIYVAPVSWSLGIGRRLWSASLRQLRAEGFDTISLWVVSRNQRAIRFYEHAGFVAEAESTKESAIGGVMLEEARYVYGTAG